MEDLLRKLLVLVDTEESINSDSGHSLDYIQDCHQ